METPEKTNIQIKNFLSKIQKFESEDFMTLVEKHLGDEEIELFVDHIEDYYGIEDDEDLGMLAQLMITGYLIGKSEDVLGNSL